MGNTIVQDFGDTVLIAGTEVIPIRNNFALGKVDYNINNDNVLSGTYNFDKGHRSPYGILGDVGALGSESLKNVLSTKWTSVLSKSAVNEVNVGYSDSRPSGDLPLSRSITAISSSGRTGSASGNSMSAASVGWDIAWTDPSINSDLTR